MTEQTKAQESANHIQTILNQFHRSNAENARLRSELASIRQQLRKLEPPAGDVFANVTADGDAKHPQAEQLCPDCGESMVQMGRTASCTACEAMFATQSDGEHLDNAYRRL